MLPNRLLAAIPALTLLACGGAHVPVPFAPRSALPVAGEPASCVMTAPPAPPLALPALDQGPAPSRANLRTWVELLADPTLAGRGSGSGEERSVAVLLSRALGSFGLAGAFTRRGFCQPFQWLGGSDQNVAGVLRHVGDGAAPAMILGAHYDGQGFCGRHGEVCPSADDNASGVATLLEVARILGAHPARLRADVVIVFFGAEEEGTVGSTFFAAHSPVPLASVSRLVNLDMVGRQLLHGQSAARFLLGDPRDAFGYVIGARDHDGSEGAIARASRAVGVEMFGVPETWLTMAGFLSDSVPFGARVPTLFLSTSVHDDYHRPGDVAAKVDFGQVERAVRLVMALVDEG